MTRRHRLRINSFSKKKAHKRTYRGGRETNVKGKMKKRMRRSSTCRVKGTCSIIV